MWKLVFVAGFNQFGFVALSKETTLSFYWAAASFPFLSLNIAGRKKHVLHLGSYPSN